MFFQANSKEFNNHSILPDLRSPFNYALLMVSIIINKEFIQNNHCTTIKNSKEEEIFVKKLKNKIGNIDITNISDRESLKRVVQEFVSISSSFWNKYLKYVKITKYYKYWWNKECSRDLNAYRTSKTSLNWKKFKRTVKRTKYFFLNDKIQEITSKNNKLNGSYSW